MGTEVSISFTTLRTQLENEKSSLFKIDESIKKIVQTPGRYLNDRFNNSSGDHGRNAPRLGGRNSFPDVANNHKNEDQFGKRKHETKTVFSRLSARADSDGEAEGDAGEVGAGAAVGGERGEGVKRARMSSAVSRELPSRADVLRAQGGDEAARGRNRRMFGSLLGTLQRFKQEEIVLQNKEEKKAQVERKIEEQARLEKERDIKQRKSLFAERDHKKATIKALEAKMSRVSEFESWEATQKYLGNFILTKTKPHLYWLPKKMSEKAHEKLAASRTYLQGCVGKKRAELQDELQRIQMRCLRGRGQGAGGGGAQGERAAHQGEETGHEEEEVGHEREEEGKRNKFAADVDVEKPESDEEGQDLHLDAPQHESPQHDSTHNDAPQHDAPQHDSSQQNHTQNDHKENESEDKSQTETSVEDGPVKDSEQVADEATPSSDIQQEATEVMETTEATAATEVMEATEATEATEANEATEVTEP